MTEYAVLYLNPDGRPDVGRAERLGGGPGASSAPPRLVRANLDEKQAAEASGTPEIVLAPAVPVKLIRPVASADGDQLPEGDSWGVEATGADRSTFDGAGCRVAILDTGIDKGHPAFRGVTLKQRNFTGCGDGDRDGHGTHCAGTVLGRDIDGRRIGVARGVTDALIGKVLNDDGGGSSPAVHDGLMWAIEEGADVIALSLGFDFPGMVRKLTDDDWPVELATSRAIREYTANLDLFRTLMSHSALQRYGPPPLIVAAAGNESRRNERPDFVLMPSLPAAVFHLSVGAVGQSGGGYAVAYFSNAPPKVVAPGVGIVSAAPGGGLAAMSGTSMACPHVAGLAALWACRLRRNGDEVSAENLLSELLHSAGRDRISDCDRSGASHVGRGLVHAPGS